VLAVHGGVDAQVQAERGMAPRRGANRLRLNRAHRRNARPWAGCRGKWNEWEHSGCPGIRCEDRRAGVLDAAPTHTSPFLQSESKTTKLASQSVEHITKNMQNKIGLRMG
jgi:hypothetical protein